MKFPTKSVKPGSSLPAMVNPAYRKEFLDDMPNKAGTRVRGADIALINEALRAVSDGTATINGKAPATRAERFIVIASYFKTAKTSFNMPFDGTVNVKDSCTVAIKHNGTPFTYNFPEHISQN